jgi:hypothetical protein
MVPAVSKALSASMEITDDQMALAMHSIAKQGRLSTPDDYDIVPSLTPAESRVVATFWLFYTEISNWYSEKNIKLGGGTESSLCPIRSSHLCSYQYEHGVSCNVGPYGFMSNGERNLSAASIR